VFPSFSRKQDRADQTIGRIAVVWRGSLHHLHILPSTTDIRVSYIDSHVFSFFCIDFLCMYVCMYECVYACVVRESLLKVCIRSPHRCNDINCFPPLAKCVNGLRSLRAEVILNTIGLVILGIEMVLTALTVFTLYRDNKL
jgi:hypothetical protein